jgi:hypothetical protein
MPKEPEQVLPKERVPTLGRIEEVRRHQAVHCQQLRCGGNPGHGKEHHECLNQHGPDEERHPVEGHSRCSVLEDGDDQLDRGHQGGDFGKSDRLGIYIDPLPRRELRAGQGDIAEPAGIGCGIQEKAYIQKEPAEEVHVVPVGVKSGERHVPGANHERHQVQTHCGYYRHGKEEHHRHAVHREELIVGVWTQQVVLGPGELSSHYAGLQTSQEEEQHGGGDVSLSDRLVVDATQPVPEPWGLAPGGLQLATDLFRVRGLSRRARAGRNSHHLRVSR